MISRRCNDDTDCNSLATLPHPVPHSTNLYPTSLLSARFLRFSPDRDAIYRIVFKSLGRHDGGKEGKRSGEKRNKRREKKEKAGRKRSRGRLWRRWRNEVGGSHGVSCFVPEARPPLSLCFFARKPRSDIVPDTPLAPVLRARIPIRTHRCTLRPNMKKRE